MTVTSDALAGLLKRSDIDFVEGVYAALLRRNADKEGLEFYVGRLRAGMRKEQLLAEIASSIEATPTVTSSPAVQDLLRRERRHRNRVVRKLLEWTGRIEPDNALTRRLRAIENNLDAGISGFPGGGRNGQQSGGYAGAAGSDLTPAEAALHRRLCQALNNPDERARPCA